MIISKIPDGGYTWALPNGTWASLINVPNAASDGPEFVRVDSDRGAIALPWPQHAPVGMKPRLDGQRFSGQNYTGGRALTYDFDSAAWLPEGPVVGRFDCIYDLQGQLVTTPPKYPDGSIDVNGNRYVALDGTPAGKIIGGDATYGPTAKAPKLSGWTDVSRDGDTFIVGQGHEQGGVHYFDGTDWRWIAHGPCHAIWTWRDGDIVAVSFYRDLGGWRTEAEVWIGTVAEFQALDLVQPLPPPPPVKPIGPTSEPLPEGTEIDLTHFVAVYDAAVWPRGGDKAGGDEHAYDMQPVTHKGEPCFWHAVFGHDGKGRLGSLVQIKDGMFHLLADLHNRDNTAHPDGPFIDTWSHTGWLPLKMRIGRQYGWTAPEHTIRKHREDGTIFAEFRWFKEQWIDKAWPKFMTPFGERMVVRFAQNNTGIPPGQTTTDPGLGMESDYLVFGAGRCRWTYDRAMDVFVGPNHAPIFPDTPKSQSDFWHVGGPRYTPVIPEWIPLATASEVPSMQIPSNVLATIKSFAAVRPVPQGDGSEAWLDSALRHGWVKALAETLCFVHGPDWGQKRRSGSSTDRNDGAPISAGSIAQRDGSAMNVWDILGGAGTGHPTLNDGEYFRVTDQVFFPVSPVNHLGDQKPRPGRAPWPAAVRHGVSGFDVAARLQGGDFDYYNLTAPLPLNVFVYTTIDHPPTHRLGRTFAQGLVQTETLLKRLTADNRKAMFIMICGPHTANNGPKPTRAEIIDMVKQQVALFVRYPKAVLALSLGNELYQGFEPPELLDPTLWAEVDQLVPLEFPFCVGQVSEAVVFGPGSFAAMHPDRGKSSADALQILADAQASDGRTVVAREPKRIEAGGSGQASGDLNFVKEELANAKQRNLPYFLHLAAGRGCHVPAMDQVQHDALALIKAEAAVVTPPGPPVPPITPPGSGHPVLDVNLRSGNPSFLSHAGYNLFVFHRKDVEAEAEKWYRKATGHAPADSDLAVMVYVRGVAERDVWGTLREAWKNGLPNGEP